ncbi:2-polyprenyl-6-methoxyphenol hydroxylase-like FAD-dependent oxidoreductase [Agrobacterium tumefaciens]|nr:hypothetical protein [Agrobacterium tumefaciens]MDP9789285.1 2-polyprenyl-6-methoxyphenol hydroxylase-like FAD-dependent oxidoreductase [Agrobacterium tumefaciens]
MIVALYYCRLPLLVGQAKAVTHVEDGEDRAVIYLSNGDSVEVDLAIGADGIASVTRKALNPGQVTNSFASYVAWRALLPENELPPLFEVFKEAMVGYTRPGIQSIGYLVPGQNGEVSQGNRRLN